jgi:hypothetical protein
MDLNGIQRASHEVWRSALSHVMRGLVWGLALHEKTGAAKLQNLWTMGSSKFREREFWHGTDARA